MNEMIRDIFFPQRLSRLPYFIRFVPFKFVDLFYVASENPPWYYHLLYLLVLLYAIRYVVVPRARDCGWPWWTALFVMIPILGIAAGLAFLFKGTSFRYADRHEESKA